MPRARTETRRRTTTASTRAADKAREKNRLRIRALRAAKKIAAAPLKQYLVTTSSLSTREYHATTILLGDDGTLAIISGTTVLAYFAREGWLSVDIRPADPVTVEDPVDEPEAVSA